MSKGLMTGTKLTLISCFSWILFLGIIPYCHGQAQEKIAYKGYDIRIEEKNKALNFSFEVSLEKEDDSRAIYKTTSKDTFFYILKRDAESLKKDKNQFLIYMHGMMGGSRGIYGHCKSQIKRWYVDAEGSDLARVISIHWPGNSPIYKADKAAAHRIAPQIDGLFSELVDSLNVWAGSPDVMAHSLGCEFFKALMCASQFDSERFKLDGVLLCAPDLDVNALDQGAPLIKVLDHCRQITVYTSKRDMTLTISSKLNEKERMGLNGPSENVLQDARLQFVEVGEIKDEVEFAIKISGHSYYRCSPLISQDMLHSIIDTSGVSFENRVELPNRPNQFRLLPN